MMKNAEVILLLALLTSLISLPARAQDSIEESTPETRTSVLAQLGRTDPRVSCDGKRVLGLCGSAKRSVRRYQADIATGEAQQYNAIQRLAGMIADRMDAGRIGNMKVKFKIILE